MRKTQKNIIKSNKNLKKIKNGVENAKGGWMQPGVRSLVTFKIKKYYIICMRTTSECFHDFHCSEDNY